MTPEILRLASAIAAGASPAHIEALRRVRDAGQMFDKPGRRGELGARCSLVIDLWAWRAVEPYRAPGVRGTYKPAVKLTAMGSAILFYANRGQHDTRTTECA